MGKRGSGRHPHSADESARSLRSAARKLAHAFYPLALPSAARVPEYCRFLQSVWRPPSADQDLVASCRTSTHDDVAAPRWMAQGQFMKEGNRVQSKTSTNATDERQDCLGKKSRDATTTTTNAKRIKTYDTNVPRRGPHWGGGGEGGRAAHAWLTS
ncbi:hypothetical protein BC834DRAFT_502005 [Gloeopeniophorella convolvens]|nr:hypothetical protein BC834DRAFT_502005 [Gloeopeniophorella convolvens]